MPGCIPSPTRAISAPALFNTSQFLWRTKHVLKSPQLEGSWDVVTEVGVLPIKLWCPCADSIEVTVPSKVPGAESPTARGCPRSQATLANTNVLKHNRHDGTTFCCMTGSRTNVGLQAAEVVHAADNLASSVKGVDKLDLLSQEPGRAFHLWGIQPIPWPQRGLSHRSCFSLSSPSPGVNPHNGNRGLLVQENWGSKWLCHPVTCCSWGPHFGPLFSSVSPCAHFPELSKSVSISACFQLCSQVTD